MNILPILKGCLLALICTMACSAEAQEQENPVYNSGSAVLWEVHHIDKKDEIAKTLETCLYANGDTYGTGQCILKASQSYDKLLNQVYQQVLQQSDTETAEAVRASERAWLASRTAEKKAQTSYMQTPRGTIIGPVTGWQDISAIRERISELMYYLGADQ